MNRRHARRGVAAHGRNTKHKRQSWLPWGYHHANMSEVFESWRQSSDCKGEWYGVGEDRSIIDRAQKNLASCKDDESQRA